MANPWKDFKPLPPDRAAKRHRADSPLTSVLVAVFIVLFCTVAGILLGAYWEFEHIRHIRDYSVNNASLTTIVLGGLLGFLTGIGAAWEAVKYGRRRRARKSN